MKISEQNFDNYLIVNARKSMFNFHASFRYCLRRDFNVSDMKYIGIHVEGTCTNVNLDNDANITKFIMNRE